MFEYIARYRTVFTYGGRTPMHATAIESYSNTIDCGSRNSVAVFPPRISAHVAYYGAHKH